MAQIPYRANLSASTFPMTLAKAGRSVIIPQADQNFDKRIDATGEVSRGSVGIPQILWAQDVLPTPDGFQSVGYDTRGTITIPGSQTLTAVISTRLPLVNPTAFAIDVLDEGDDLASWDISPTVTTPPVYSEVIESATIGNPAPSYELRQDEGAADAAWFVKEFDLGASTNIEVDFDFAFLGSAGNEKQQMTGVICNSVAGAGLKVVYDGDSGLLGLNVNSQLNAQGLTVIATETVGALSFDVWYHLNVTIVINSDTSKTVTATLSGGAIPTPIEVTNTFALSLGPLCGAIFNTSVDTASTYMAINYDNYRVRGDGIGFESELESATISFFSNNTANWSHSSVNYENLSVIEPVGFVSPANQNEISTAFVRGQAFICIRTQSTLTTKIYRLQIDEDTNELTFEDVTTLISDSMPSPFTIDDVNCIVGSFNYLVLLTKATAFWSSTTTPTDFAQSLVSGAGFGFPNNLKDNIAFAKEHSSGFFIYTPKNVVFAAYTGNARYPWKFREVTGSGGYALQTQASGDTNTALQVGVTVTGQLQSLNPDAAILVAPEVSDFFERVKAYDLFDSATNTFSLVQNLMRGPYTEFQIFFLLDRYILCPYGRSGSAPYKFEYILVFDTQLRRYGKLKRACNFIYTDEELIFFVDGTTGVITSLNTDILTVDGSGDPTHAGVLLLGKFQFVRDRFIQMEQVELESSAPTTIVPVVDRIFTARLIPSFDGKNLSTGVALTPNTVRSVGTLMSFDSHTTAKNFCLLVRGAFDLCHLGMIINPHGRF